MTDKLSTTLAGANTALLLTESKFRLTYHTAGEEDGRQLFRISRYMPTSGTTPADICPISGLLSRQGAVMWLAAFTIGAS